MNVKFTALAEPYKRQIGNITFVVSSFGNANAKLSANELLLKMLEQKIERNE